MVVGPPAREPQPTVVAIVWTHNRYEVLAACLRAVNGQSRLADHVVVVDIASKDGTAARLRVDHPELCVVELVRNDGPGAALALGLEIALDSAPDYFWLVEDDSIPGEACLEMALEIAVGVPNLGMVGPDSASVRRGQWIPDEALTPGTTANADLVYLDGALVSADAIRRAGLPRTDFFIMMVDVEYPLRVASLGYRMVHAGLPYVQLRLGAHADDRSWRAYYQTRNHLRMSLDMRSPILLFGFFVRSLKHFSYAAAHGEWALVRIRMAGVLDALRGRMGRTVEPPQR